MRHDHEPIRTHEILDLAARHERDPDADDPRWSRALEALEQDDEAFEAALEVDPLLLFQRLPEIEVDADEIAEMRRSVHEIRRSREIEARIDPVPPSTGQLPSRRRSSHSWRLAAVLAVLLLGASLFLRGGFEAGAPERGAETLAPNLAAELAIHDGPAAAALEAAGHLPLVESLDNGSELIQIESAEMSIVVASLPSDFEI